MKRIITAAAAAIMLAAPAFAATQSFEMEVRYSKPALATEAGAAAEYENIRKQVAERCAAEHAGFGYGENLAVSLCTRRTLNKTVNAIGEPALVEVHRAQR